MWRCYIYQWERATVIKLQLRKTLILFGSAQNYLVKETRYGKINGK